MTRAECKAHLIQFANEYAKAYTPQRVVLVLHMVELLFRDPPNGGAAG